ncbi:MAG: hypothetical protein WCD66_11520 [Rhodanobacteraceae bacterium]
MSIELTPFSRTRLCPQALRRNTMTNRRQGQLNAQRIKVWRVDKAITRHWGVHIRPAIPHW